MIDLAGIDCFQRVVHISLDGRKYTDETIDELSKLESLQSVTLAGTQISTAGVNRLRRSRPGIEIEGR